MVHVYPTNRRRSTGKPQKRQSHTSYTHDCFSLPYTLYTSYFEVSPFYNCMVFKTVYLILTKGEGKDEFVPLYAMNVYGVKSQFHAPAALLLRKNHPVPIE